MEPEIPVEDTNAEAMASKMYPYQSYLLKHFINQSKICHQ